MSSAVTRCGGTRRKKSSDGRGIKGVEDVQAWQGYLLVPFVRSYVRLFRRRLSPAAPASARAAGRCGTPVAKFVLVYFRDYATSSSLVRLSPIEDGGSGRSGRSPRARDAACLQCAAALTGVLDCRTEVALYRRTCLQVGTPPLSLHPLPSPPPPVNE